MMLLVTPSRKPPESLLGYTLRVAEANGYDTPWHVLSVADVVQGQMQTAGFPVKKLAAVLGREPEALDDAAYRRDSTGEYQLLGQSLGSGLNYRPLRLKKPAICHHCVEELHYIDAFWDLNFAVACPHHGIIATEACPVCSAPLTWFRPGLLQCKCGADLNHISTSAADPAVVELMRLLFAKVHGQASAPGPADLLPTDMLARLSLRALLDLIGTMGSFAFSGQARDRATSAFKIVSAAAEALQHWPHGYRAFLHRLNTHTGNQASKTVSLRQRYMSFYAAMFNDRRDLQGFSFLRAEFIRFGLNEWGRGLVDPRMTKGVDIAGRFASRSQLAKAIGVDSRTLGKWAEDGKISLDSSGSGKRGRRYMGDLASLPIPQEAEGRILRQREAAKMAGLPVSVLRSLKRSGHYAVKHMHVHKSGFHEADLYNFTQLLLGKSPLVSKGTLPDGALPLDYVMQELRFWSGTGKAKVISGYLEGDFQSVGRLDDTISSIHFAKEDMTELARNGRAEVSQGAISQSEAATCIACDPGAIQGLAAKGYLVAIPGPSRTRLTRQSVEAFAAKYLSLSGFANERLTTTLKLKNLCKSLGIEVMSIDRNNSQHSSFVVHNMREALVKALDDSRPKPRPISSDMLIRYLEGLRLNGQRLPRKGTKPNLVAIAGACGFDRNAFYSNQLVIRALKAFDEEDKHRHALCPAIAPLDALTRYLEQLDRTGASLPCYGGKPNKFAIARAVGFSRDIFRTNPAFDKLIEIHFDSNKQRHPACASSTR
jgi:hypothetical protein